MGISQQRKHLDLERTALQSGYPIFYCDSIRVSGLALSLKPMDVHSCIQRHVQIIMLMLKEPWRMGTLDGGSERNTISPSL